MHIRTNTTHARTTSLIPPFILFFFIGFRFIGLFLCITTPSPLRYCHIVYLLLSAPGLIPQTRFDFGYL
ncbi:hypothetical protein FIBSPDRAFT_866559 [Athelia psychrophila]|uniref:Uncharacterized protein n=1 Tax=Athelia psychrophila TaxID=1759441 RepID=A0A166ERS0_9AGAM|nr:hypothetical protein FIBSPDRAFT_866559 [Fibularhizoctonia sp. CBS 109695]